MERRALWRAIALNARDTGLDSICERECRWLRQRHGLDNFEAKHKASEDRKTVGGNESNVRRDILSSILKRAVIVGGPDSRGPTLYQIPHLVNDHEERTVLQNSLNRRMLDNNAGPSSITTSTRSARVTDGISQFLWVGFWARSCLILDMCNFGFSNFRSSWSAQMRSSIAQMRMLE